MRQSDRTGIDIRDLLFERIRDGRFIARLHAREGGVLSGAADVRVRGEEIGVRFRTLLAEGTPLHEGTVVAEYSGTPKQMALCEEVLIGLISKYSGVATAATSAREASGQLRVVCGAWKKMPIESKLALRRAITTGGIPTRLVDQNFIYLDKNYVRMMGGIKPTLDAARGVGQRVRAIQIRGDTGAIGHEAIVAAEAGADILMVDTGNVGHVREVSDALAGRRLREVVRIAFAGGVRIADLLELQNEDIDIVDLGRAVIDAPLVDMSMDIVGRDDEAPPCGNGER